jgi:hypothetical protein
LRLSFPEINLREQGKGQKDRLCSFLFRAASETLRAIAADPKHPGAAIVFRAA